jgi:hypothetical protein
MALDPSFTPRPYYALIGESIPSLDASVGVYNTYISQSSFYEELSDLDVFKYVRISHIYQSLGDESRRIGFRMAPVIPTLELGKMYEVTAIDHGAIRIKTVGKSPAPVLPLSTLDVINQTLCERIGKDMFPHKARARFVSSAFDEDDTNMFLRRLANVVAEPKYNFIPGANGNLTQRIAYWRVSTDSSVTRSEFEELNDSNIAKVDGHAAMFQTVNAYTAVLFASEGRFPAKASDPYLPSNQVEADSGTLVPSEVLGYGTGHKASFRVGKKSFDATFSTLMLQMINVLYDDNRYRFEAIAAYAENMNQLASEYNDLMVLVKQQSTGIKNSILSALSSTVMQLVTSVDVSLTRYILQNMDIRLFQLNRADAQNKKEYISLCLQILEFFSKVLTGTKGDFPDLSELVTEVTYLDPMWDQINRNLGLDSFERAIV